MSLLGAYGERRRRGPIVYGQPTVGDGHLMKVLMVQAVMYRQSMGGRGMVVQVMRGSGEMKLRPWLW